MEIKKFAAIDIGSNSVRLLIEHVLENGGGPLFKKSSLIRVPVRLGANAFTDHKIPETSIRRLVDAMTAFRHLMRANEVLHYKGCATSAMREAVNGAEIVKRIKDEAGVKIDIISGTLEADMIFSSQSAMSEKTASCLFVDVGGGSTEITVFKNNKSDSAESFNIGTIRLLQNTVTKEEWKEMRDWLREQVRDMKSYTLIGSGGNINRISKMAQLKTGKGLPYEQLNNIVNELKQHSYEDRMKLFDLNPDRADVIVPAGEIFLTIMKWLELSKIFVPKIGLGDGIVRQVYKEYLEGKRSKI